MLFRRLTALLVAVAVFLNTVPTLASPENNETQSQNTLEARNIDPDDLVEAKKLVDDWISKNRQENLAKEFGQPVIQKVTLLHFGSYIPKSLRFIATTLEKSDFKVSITLVTKEEIENELKKNEKESLLYIESVSKTISKKLDTDEIDTSKKLSDQVREISRSAHLKWLDLWGMPTGFTLWIKLNRTARERSKDLKVALGQLPLGVPSFLASFYFKNPADFHASHVIIPTLTFMGWITINIYHSRWIGEFQSQGRDIKRAGESFFKMIQRKRKNYLENQNIQEPETTIRVVKKPLFQRLGVFGRSVLTNSIIMSSLKVSDFIFKDITLQLTHTDVSVIVTNSFWSLFSRYAFEEWLASKQARTMKDGTIVVEPGTHSPEVTQTIRFWFEIFNGFSKWLHLFQVPHANLIFPLMGVLGTLNTLYDSRFWAKDKLNTTKEWLLDKALNRSRPKCETLLFTEKNN